MVDITQVRLRSLALFFAPVMMLAAIVFHPYLVNELDVEAATAAVAEPKPESSWLAFSAIVFWHFHSGT